MPTNATYRHPTTGHQFTLDTDTPEGLREAGDAVIAGFQLVTVDPTVGGNVYDPRTFPRDITPPPTLARFTGAGQPAAFDLEAAISGLNTDSILDALTAGAITFDQALTAIQQIHTIAGGSGDSLMVAFDVLTSQGFSPPGGVAPPGAAATPTGLFGMPTGSADGGLPIGGADFDPRDYDIGDPSPPGFARAGIPTPGDVQLGPITERRARAFAQQTPSEQFQRFLAEATRGQGIGTPAVQRGYSQRGTTLQGLAPLFGYGATPETGGVGTAMDFFRQQNFGLPSQDLTRQALHDATRVLGVADPMSLTGQDLGQFTLFGDLEEGPSNQFNALMSFLGGSGNPIFRRGLGNLLGRIFTQQQATTPEVPFLQFAQQRGFF